MNRACPICNNHGDSEIIGRISMVLPDVFHLPGDYNVVSCSKCGFTYGDTAATLDDYASYYKKNNVYPSAPKRVEAVGLNKLLASSICDYIQKTEFLIDMGCGNGELLYSLDSLGYTNLCGMDTSKQGIEMLNQNGIKGIYTSIYNDYNGEKAAGLILGGVLEHLLCPAEAINSSRQYIRDDGFLFVTLPYIDDILLHSNSTFYYCNYEHINFFSISSLVNLMRTCGFSLEKIIKYSVGKDDLIGIFRKKAKEDDCELEYSDKDQRTLSRFFEASAEENQKTADLLNDFKIKNTPLVLWGCGAMLFAVLASTNLSECNIAAIVDSNQIKKTWTIINRHIDSPDIISSLPSNVNILIFNAYGGNAIVDDIEQRGLHHPVHIIKWN